MISLFGKGFNGLSDSLFRGQRGSVYRAVGIDSRSEPGKLKVQQKLVKDSGGVVDELCKVSVNVSDGSRLWFSSESGKIWRESGGTYSLAYNLELSAFDILSATYFGEYDASNQGNTHHIRVKPDGSKFFSVEINGGDTVYEYGMSTSNDITTASLTNSKDIGGQTVNARGVFVRADGLKMYVFDNSSTLYQYTLSTAWDVTTASYDSVSFDVQTGVSDIWFKSDGTVLYVISAGEVKQLELSTAWDISSIELMDYLIIAGGGGGGYGQSGDGGGGGGAGGYIESQAVPAVGSYPVVVGGGGAGSGSTDGASGEDSSALGLTATGGGGGGGLNNDGLTGGSGGGGSNIGVGGSGTANQGNDGADGDNTSPDNGGGGGGAGATTTTSEGGDGISSSISGSSVCRGGGGGGGSFGFSPAATASCGGGAGGNTSSEAGSNATANTGGGGGGGLDNDAGGDGASGVVIIAYKTGLITATGGTVTTSGGNTIHTFTSNGTFEVTDTSNLFDAESGTRIAFNSDGTKMYISGTEDILQYSLLTAWDITTATSDGTLLQTNQDTSEVVNALSFDSTGLNLYVSQTSDGEILQYKIDTTENTTPLSAIQFLTNDYGETTTQSHIVWTTENYIWKIPVEDMGDWEGNVQLTATFANGNDTHHPVVEQNETLYFGDGKVIASLTTAGSFTAETDFNVPENETITALTDFDIDILVGTKTVDSGRVLRWDGFSLSWSSEDDIYVKGGVSAFMKDDNYRYVIDEEGTIWFYNGEQNEVAYRVPEVLNGLVRVNPNATAYWRRTPLFGLSNAQDNPVLQGVYGLGKYSRGYSTSMSLDFPLPSGEFSDVEIGSILVDQRDLYVSWKDGSDVGVAKLDYTAKYENAYMETMALASPDIRHQVKTITEAVVPYFSLPDSTSVTVGYKKTYEGSFTDYVMQTDSKRKVVEAKNPSVPDVANPQLRVTFGVNGNDAPEIEDVLFTLAPIGKR